MNQTREIIAIKAAVDTVNRCRMMVIKSNSKSYVNGLTQHLQKWEVKGFINTVTELLRDYHYNSVWAFQSYLLVVRTYSVNFRTSKIYEHSRNHYDIAGALLKVVLRTVLTNTENAPEIKATVPSIQRWQARTTLEWVKGNAGIRGNKEADRLANERRKEQVPDEVNLEIDGKLHLSGMN
ncbi:hypothetical protein J3R30DRAFT_3864057 [Lentinula aciculospora]|uniref:RNase H type-1 domain-containing protein n=1 Tax=Lentinula aciculospora TaxID=153920 RepID=A0A9W9AEA4_9AGAR|nr:hypothetical protein J3R30DRAFT_3864057 [Lentinula aciculospora]